MVACGPGVERIAEEVAQRFPEAKLRIVEDAGHSIQGDQPLVLARLIEEFAGWA